ncbi:MAG TPA: hypothetical protein VKQ34_01925 [Candidatus Saccharimonadales bacterium]|nr:hypothetical protein [Candidatus Saccharimonadales bacterium]
MRVIVPNRNTPAFPSQLGRLPTLMAVHEDLDSHSSVKAAQNLRQALGSSRDILISATTVFPFTLFPDTITVDREKLSIAHRFFFKIAEVITISIGDILNVTADVGPFFGSLKIASRFFDAKKPYRVNYLWRKDALEIKRLVQGYVIATKKKVDCSSLPVQELKQILEELGHGEPSQANE